jgi:hypothetical protein
MAVLVFRRAVIASCDAHKLSTLVSSISRVRPSKASGSDLGFEDFHVELEEDVVCDFLIL